MLDVRRNLYNSHRLYVVGHLEVNGRDDSEVYNTYTSCSHMVE